MYISLFLSLILACGGKDTGTGTPTATDSGSSTDGGTPVDTAGDGGTPTDTGTITDPVDADKDGFDTPEDCDDSNPEINPDATEICNGVDDDCDGWIDLDDNNLDWSTTTLYFPDGDGDGYGDQDQGQQLCEKPDLQVTVGGDCDDNDAAVNPDATEVCDDGVDNNCDGSLNGCVLSGDRSTADALVVLQGPAAGALAGSAQLTAFVDDGEDEDMVVAGPGAAGLDGETVGAVWVVHGPMSGFIDLSEPDASWTASSSDLGVDPGLGLNIVAGDANDDGFDDVIVAAPRADYDGLQDAGSVTVIYGAIGSSAGTDNDIADEPGVLISATEGLGLGLGTQLVDDLTATGDLNLLVGTDSGNAIYLYNQAPISEGGTHTATATIISGTTDDVGFGAWFDGRGDIDGDGQVDLVVAAPGADAVYLMLGPVSGELSAADASRTLSGSIAGSDVTGLGDGLVQSATDINGDGYVDLLLGDSDGGPAGGGAAYLFLGPLSTVTEPSLSVTATGRAEGLGTSGLIGGDFDLDGQPDLLLGTPGVGAGAVLAFIGRSSGSFTTSDSDARFVGSVDGQRLGTSLAMPTDLDQDGILDVIAGAPGDNDSAGATYVFSGAAW
ncbi:MAG: hypothetical protein GXP62_14750 [Oligoflexia bacterium]|nr:hypothetical protein [Oligoflexia bacterium]